MIVTTKLIDIREQLNANNSFNGFYVGFSHLYHNFAMFFLNCQIWMNSVKQFIKAFTSNIGFVNHFAIEMFSFFRNSLFPVMDSEKFLKPKHNAFING